MRKTGPLLPLALAATVTLTSAGLSSVSADTGKALVLRKVQTTIAVDGIVDPLWNEADSVSDFVQFAPYNCTDPSVKTIAKVLTTDWAFYCVMICYDDAKNIQRTKGLLDAGGGDIVSLMIDTFDDKRTAYKFAVTASGVRADCRLLDDARNRDYNWDGVWFSAARIHDWGFVVEMEIPYRSIQYHKGLKSGGSTSTGGIRRAPKTSTGAPTSRTKGSGSRDSGDSPSGTSIRRSRG